MTSWQEYLRFAVTLTAVLDPFLAVPIFVSVTAGQDMRARLRLAQVVTITVFAVLALLVGPLPLLFASMPGARRLTWLVLGFCLYLPLVLLARWYVHRAERNERDFVRLVEDK